MQKTVAKIVFIQTFAALLLLALITSGCAVADDDPVIEAVITVSDSEPSVGDRVTLDSSDSIIELEPVTFSWQLERPDGSIAVIEEPTAPNTSFVADVAGDYLVTLTITAEDMEDSRSVVVTAVEN